MADITKEEVITIAEALIREGTRPRAHIIRERLGRGSNTTIKKHLDKWLEEREKETLLTVPDEFTHIWRTIEHYAWRLLVPFVQQAEEKVINEFTEKIRIQEEEIKELQAQASSLEDELENVREDKEQEIKNLKLQVSDQIKAYAEIEVLYKVNTQTITDLKIELTSLREHLEAVTQELQAAHRERDQIQATLEAERQSFERERRNIEGIIASLRR